MSSEDFSKTVNVMPIAAIMMITEVIFELQDSDKELARRLIKRFKALYDNPLGSSSPESMKFIQLVINEMEERMNG